MSEKVGGSKPISHAQTGQTVSLGKSSQNHHAGALPNAIERSRILDVAQRREVRRIFVVGFVQHNNHVVRNLREELVNLRRFQDGAGRIVRVRQKNQTRVRI